MRILILIALLFAFTAGSFADMAHAFAPDHQCAHHQMDKDDGENNEPCHSEQNQNQCDDCCCIHSHSMATAAIHTKASLDASKQNIFAASKHHYSTDIPGLKRPPRI